MATPDGIERRGAMVLASCMLALTCAFTSGCADMGIVGESEREASAAAEPAYEQLCDAIDQHKAIVVIEGSGTDLWRACWRAALDPDNVCLDETPQPTLTVMGKTLVLLSYNYPHRRGMATLARCERQAQAIADMAPAGDDWERALYAHDAICRMVRYDPDEGGNDLIGYGNHTRRVDGAFVDHVAVCQGYAAAYELVCDKMGIRCDTVVSEDHAWNVVTIDGRRYHVDLTNDDMDEKDSSGREYVCHDYFMLSNDEMEAAGERVSQDETPCDRLDDTRDGYFRRMGALFDEYDPKRVRAALERQVKLGQNAPAVRFTNREAYRACCDDLDHGDGNAAPDGASSYWPDDELYVVTAVMD